ncbi:hypothetical protein K6T82_06875 [Flavobacterium sp. 17A]|uniref:Uncharacterized protein n=1 Tax=Flavobacterium potami TaxID=2872310 RepID=A0A9X1H9R0_9FLAO|nr:hypothetical protein [Flavobacterium potami]MBZ4034482.1 hypothetical protein [Flavobacterium potami]
MIVSFLMRKVFYKNLTSELTEINLLENGFSMQEPFGVKPIILDWKNVENVYFSEDKKQVIIQSLKKEFVLKNNFMGWYEFIQNVPSKFTNFDFDYVSDFMKSLQPCDICGIVAVKENHCLVCQNVPWNDQINGSKIDYIKQKQLTLFASNIKEGKEVKQYAKPEYGFKVNENWKLHL